ncbi:MAG: hypothetical protein HYX24_03940 [Candidatus Aenigmarchaeota archaeon]|nr:hypothetical protein [Candidatus Aenigmarchaeota archaeon]
MAIEFRYKEEKSRLTGNIFRPIADIELKSKTGEWIECHPYIDSGADISLIPISLGKLLGFEVSREKIQELRGIGEGVVPVIIVTVPVKIGSHEISARIACALIEEVVPLLGRLDLFDKFRIVFEENDRKIIFDWKGV